MKVTYLGTGHAYETPNSNCDCGTCDAQRVSVDPKNNRLNTSMVVSGSGDKSLLIDCGDLKAQMPALREALGLRDGKSVADAIEVLLTHSHNDHVWGHWRV